MGTEKDIEDLIEDLKDKDWNVRRKAAWAIGEIGDRRAAEPLIHALKDEDNGVRWRIIEALGRIGDSRAVEPLTQALKDEDWYDQEIIEWALAEIRRKIGN